jgi:hypothetical protein
MVCLPGQSIGSPGSVAYGTVNVEDANHHKAAQIVATMNSGRYRPLFIV